MRIPFTRHRNDDQHGGVGSPAESYTTTSTRSGDQSRIPDGYPSVLVMQRHPVTGEPGSFVYLHTVRSDRVPGPEYEVAEINPSTGEILHR